LRSRLHWRRWAPLHLNFPLLGLLFVLFH
jgi:hypothetical protein